MSSLSDRQRMREDEVLRGNAKLATSASSRGTLTRLLTDWSFTSRVVRYLVHLPVRMETEDRRVLEQVIFPYFGTLPTMHSVLFVGCDWYTRHYPQTYFRGKDYWTIDPASGQRKFAGKQHIVGALERLDDFFPPERFDLIVCNGVYGFGLDTREQCERAFDLCQSRLKSGGHFVFGWDDVPARTPVPLTEIASLQRLPAFPFPPLGSSRYVTNTPYRHTYDFYRKSST